MKKLIVIVIIVLVLVLFMVNSKPILNYASECFWTIVAEQFEKEETERLRRIENGELVRGKDTILIWNNLYEIGHYYDGNHLTINEDVSEVVLKRVQKHRISKKSLYIVSEEGYAVINEDNLCRVYIVDEKHMEGNLEETDQDNMNHKNEPHDAIQYLSSYDQFTEEERKIFDKLKKR